MAEVRIKTSGTTLSGAVIENISTEDTLAAVLDQLKILNKSQTDFQKYAKDTEKKDKKDTDKTRTKAEQFYDKFKNVMSGNKSSAGSSSGSSLFSGLMPEISGVTELFAKFVPELELALISFEAFEKVAAIFSDVEHAAGSLTKAFIDGNTKASAYIEVFEKMTSDIPIVSTFVGVLGIALSTLEDWNDKINSLSVNGANFNNSLIELRTAASQVGIPLDKFAEIVKSNINNFAQFGTVMDGVRVYQNVANVSMKQFGRELEDMGISLDQYAQDLPAVLALIGPSAKARGDSDNQLANSAFQLTKEFDAMAKLTGKSSQEQASELQKREANAAFQLKLSTMTTSQADSLQNAMAQIQATMGSTAASLFEMKILGIAPLSKDMIMMQATMPGLNNEFNNLTDSVNRGTLTQNELNNSTANAISSALSSGKSIDNILNAAASGIGGSAADIAENFNQIFADKSKFLHNGIFDKQAYINELNNLKKTQDARDKIKQSFDAFDVTVRKAVDSFSEHVLIPIYEKMTPYIERFASWMDAHPLPLDEIFGFVKSAGQILISVFGFFIDHSRLISDTLLGISIGLGILAAAFLIANPEILVFGIVVAGIIALFGFLGEAVRDLLAFIKFAIDHPADAFKSVATAVTGIGFTGGTSSTGSVVQDFGKGTATMLHGAEAVLTEKQLSNLVTNTAGSSNNSDLANLLGLVNNKLDSLLTLNNNGPMVTLLSDLNELVEQNLKVNKDIARNVK